MKTNGLVLGTCLLALAACSEDKVLLEKTMTSIGPAGGMARSADGTLELRIPTGALSSEQEITVETYRNQLFPRLKSSIYELGPDGLTFDRPVQLRITNVAASDEDLTIAQIDGEHAYVLDSSEWDEANGELTANLEHFSSYAVITVYNPCGNKVCGDSCVACDPLDPTCVEPAPNPKACNQSGLCVSAALPMCNPVVDAGTPDSGPPPIDAGTVDSGVPGDAGTPDAGSPDAGPPPCVDTEAQYPQPLVDILIVMDSSCSMGEEQQSIASSFGLILNTLTQNNTDFHIGVTTTDVTPGGEQGSLVGTVPILDANTPNLATEFGANVQVGVNGSAIETGLAGMSMSVSAANAATFHRGGSSLAVIIVSDEPDQDVGTVQSHVDQVLAIKGPHPTRRVQINTITGGAIGCNGPNGNASAETRYEQARVLTDGAHSVICTAPYSQALTDLGDTDFGFNFVFDLNNTPTDVSSIVVTINGTPVSQGWTFDATLNAIVFDPLAVPEPSAVVETTYTCN